MAKAREVFMLIGSPPGPAAGGPSSRGDQVDVVLWSDASDSPVFLPDSRSRWEAIWSRRDLVTEIAHSHPVGPLCFSREDETTMAALVTALGKPMRFSVVAPRGMVRCEPGPGREDYAPVIVEEEPWWASLLRLASGMTTKTPQEE